MADAYVPTGGANVGFADISAFVADSNAINSATKTALNTALTNIGGLMGSFTPGTNGSIVDTNVPAAHPDFDKVPPHIRFLIVNELNVLKAAVTAHA
jgi:hypothetical protein